MILANFYGGAAYMIRDYKSVFDNLLRITLENGHMNSD